MTRAWLCRQEETSGQQIESRDVPFDGALTPRQRDGGLDGS